MWGRLTSIALLIVIASCASELKNLKINIAFLAQEECYKSGVVIRAGDNLYNIRYLETPYLSLNINNDTKDIVLKWIKCGSQEISGNLEKDEELNLVIEVKKRNSNFSCFSPPKLEISNISPLYVISGTKNIAINAVGCSPIKHIRVYLNGSYIPIYEIDNVEYTSFTIDPNWLIAGTVNTLVIEAEDSAKNSSYKIFKLIPSLPPLASNISSPILDIKYHTLNCFSEMKQAMHIMSITLSTSTSSSIQPNLLFYAKGSNSNYTYNLGSLISPYSPVMLYNIDYTGLYSLCYVTYAGYNMSDEKCMNIQKEYLGEYEIRLRNSSTNILVWDRIFYNDWGIGASCYDTIMVEDIGGENGISATFYYSSGSTIGSMELDLSSFKGKLIKWDVVDSECKYQQNNITKISYPSCYCSYLPDCYHSSSNGPLYNYIY